MNVNYRISRLLAGLLLAASLSGCVAATNPIGPPEAAVEEPRLLGVWTADGGGGDNRAWEFVHVLAKGDDKKHLDILVANHEEKTWVVFDGYVTAVGEREFLNLRIVAADGTTTAQMEKYPQRANYPYGFAAIAFESDGRLKTAYAGEVLAKAVQANQLAGETQGDWDVFVSAPSESIANLLGGADDAVLFAKPFYYKRLGP